MEQNLKILHTGTLHLFIHRCLRFKQERINDFGCTCPSFVIHGVPVSTHWVRHSCGVIFIQPLNFLQTFILHPQPGIAWRARASETTRQPRVGQFIIPRPNKFLPCVLFRVTYHHLRRTRSTPAWGPGRKAIGLYAVFHALEDSLSSHRCMHEGV